MMCSNEFAVCIIYLVIYFCAANARTTTITYLFYVPESSTDITGIHSHVVHDFILHTAFLYLNFIFLIYLTEINPLQCGCGIANKTVNYQDMQVSDS